LKRLFPAAGCALVAAAALGAPASARQPVDNNVLNFGQCIARGALAPRDASSFEPVVVVFGRPDADPNGWLHAPSGQDDSGLACSTISNPLAP